VDYTREMEFLHGLSSKAGEELSQRFGTNVHIRHKQDNSLVTDADLASEKLIIETLRRDYPNDLILSEEAGLSSKHRIPGQHIWIIDPLDGTTNFANNYPFFCVSIARGRFGADGHIETVAGAVHDPIRKKTYVAERGHGAWVDGRRIQVTQDRPFKDAFLATGFAYHSGENLKRGIEFFHAVAETCQSIRRDGAAALDLAMVAEGVYDGYWESGLGPWDLAAGNLLVTEAGGTIQNFASSASKYNIEDGNIVCGTPTVVSFISNLLKIRGSSI
jgi:myo-inositol-1(or 4)-monophosphatase